MRGFSFFFSFCFVFCSAESAESLFSSPTVYGGGGEIYKNAIKSQRGARNKGWSVRTREGKKAGREEEEECKSVLQPSAVLQVFSSPSLPPPLASPAEVTLTWRNVLPLLCRGWGGGGGRQREREKRELLMVSPVCEKSSRSSKNFTVTSSGFNN